MDITDLTETTLIPEDYLEEEIDSAEKAMASLEALEGLYENISIHGGVSMEHARQMVNEHALTLDARYPVQSFTHDPSKTNLAPSLEAIDVGRMVLVVALLGAAVIILIKLTKWLVQFFRTNKMKEAKTTVLATNVVEMAAALEKAKAVIPASALENIRQIVAKESGLRMNLTGMQEDVLTGGLFSATALTCWRHLDEWEKALTEKMRRFRAMSNQHIRDNDVAGADEFIRLMSAVGDPLQMFVFPEDMIANVRVNASTDSIILGYAQAIQQAAFNATQTRQRGYDARLTDRIVNAPFLLINYYGPIDNSLQNAVKLDKNAADLRKVDRTTSINPGVAEAYKKAINNITEETRALTLMWNFVELVADARRTLLLNAAQNLNAILRHVTMEANKGEESDRARMAAIAADLRKRLRNFG